jgi:hypothetical protein
MGQGQTTLGHHLDQIPEAQLEAKIPPHAEDDYLAFKVPPLNSSSRPPGDFAISATLCSHQTHIIDREKFAPEPVGACQRPAHRDWYLGSQEAYKKFISFVYKLVITSPA